MKKIFAIALALVMVLSMTSAFAAATLPGTCDWAAWDCTTYTSNCGVAKAEVVKFVKTNNCAPYAFEQSDCAAVVSGLPVFYAVKVTFDANVNEQWFKHDATVLAFSEKDIATAGTTKSSVELESLVAYDDVKKGGIFWLEDNNGTLALVADEDFTDACVFGDVAVSTGAKVCADVEYKFDGLNMAVELGNYIVEVATDTDVDYVINVKDRSGNEADFIVDDGKFVAIQVGDKEYVAYVNGTFVGIDAANKKYLADGATCNFLDEMMAFLKLEFGMCVNADGIKAFFGWDDDNAFESCVKWDKSASAIVNADCVLSIPKTGDVSVVAYAVMAVVAAAGTMLKK